MKADPELKVDFESDRITLDIPLKGTDILSGWKIIPLTPPLVSSDESSVNSEQYEMNVSEYYIKDCICMHNTSS